MLNWLFKNKEWLFSGLGVTLITGIITFFVKNYKLIIVKKRQNNSITFENIRELENIEKINASKEFYIPVVIYRQHIKDMKLELSPKLAVVANNLKDLSQEKIKELIIRQIKVHYKVFEFPNPNAIIPINTAYLGRFSWDEKIIVCEEIFQVPYDSDMQQWKTWTSMQSEYVEAYNSSYRNPNWKYNITDLQLPKVKLSEILHLINIYINEFPGISPNLETQIIKAKNLFEKIDLSREADPKEFNNPVVQLEMVLSTLHIIIKQLMPRVIEL